MIGTQVSTHYWHGADLGDKGARSEWPSWDGLEAFNVEPHLTLTAVLLNIMGGAVYLLAYAVQIPVLQNASMTLLHKQRSCLLILLLCS